MSEATTINSKSAGGLEVFRWLGAGLKDFRAKPALSILYGFGFFALSWVAIGFLFLTGLEWMLLPAVAGALLVGPIVAIGLYRISWQLEGEKNVGIAAPGQIALIGCVLMILLLMWIRAATILFALFFGLKPFPGFLEILSTLFLSTEGLALVVVGSVVGGLFAALTFAITIYSIPMLLREEIDAFTAMGRSFAKSLGNLGATIRWGIVVTLLTSIGFLTGMLGMIIIFPLLGYATWHAYRDMFPEADTVPVGTKSKKSSGAR